MDADGKKPYEAQYAEIKKKWDDEMKVYLSNGAETDTGTKAAEPEAAKRAVEELSCARVAGLENPIQHRLWCAV